VATTIQRIIQATFGEWQGGEKVAYSFQEKDQLEKEKQRARVKFSTDEETKDAFLEAKGEKSSFVQKDASNNNNKLEHDKIKRKLFGRSILSKRK